MDLVPDEEQQQIIDLAADFLQREMPLSRLHGAPFSVDAARAQREKFAELGWAGIGLAESSGGVGMSVVEEVLILREVGRVVGPTALIPTILATKLADSLGLAELRDRLLAGGCGAAYAVAEAPLSSSQTGVRGTARVYDIQDAACVLVAVADEVLLLEVEDGASLEPVPWLDAFTPVARRDLGGLRLLGRAPAAAIRINGMLLTAAMLTGLAEGAVAMIADYAKIRETFGRKIGSYQAVRHPIAEGAARSDHAKSLLYFAALAFAEGRVDAELQARSAKVIAHRAATRNADINIQLHGGIGITDDLPAHHFMKRTLMLAPWFGGRKTQLDALLDQPLLTI
ncbi:acyl-CoA dehydrogenase family protein [Sphingobium sp. TKS]|uniref:acyl-CoA dehydrogenase family protein n=1 Tax=Sphingobium sp. TKS TaxID=1315974 RepID=UPI0007703CDB|nr:acyl-CoA dehydrogenase family protein [Sphingobium sp. TKS]AMK25629.1 acyl-CoA dehydrogenase [Sphingobium sp. TKS]